MEKDKLIEEMLNEMGDRNNTIDINAYGRGLVDMYDILANGYTINLTVNGKSECLPVVFLEHGIIEITRDGNYWRGLVHYWDCDGLTTEDVGCTVKISQIFQLCYEFIKLTQDRQKYKTLKFDNPTTFKISEKDFE